MADRRTGSARRLAASVLAPVLLLATACGGIQLGPHAPATPSAAPPPVATSSRAAATPAPSTGVPAALRGTEWERLPTTRHVVALTFDAGANADAVEPVLATLLAEHVPATFFLTGQWVQRYPAQARQIGRDFPVGSHSQTHPMMTTLSDDAVRGELTTAAAAITAGTGRDPRPLFRFPFGDRNRHLIDVVNAAGYGSIRWTVDTTGWRGTSGGMSVDGVRARVLAGLGPGEIVLMHLGSNPDDGSRLDADALPGLIREIRARAYDFAALADFL